MPLSLDRSISLHQSVLYGIGVIIGAGIYTLVGIAAGTAGNALWISFIIAGIIAALTALSYAELAPRFPKEAAETVYVIHAFRNNFLGFFAGYLSLITALFSAATVAFGFTAYLKLFLNIDPIITSIALIALLSAVNFLGIQKSIKLNNALTYLTLLGLVIIIIFGSRFVGRVDLLLGYDDTSLVENFFSLSSSLFSAAALVFFAYLGFEEIANISEEVRQPKRTLPKAIFISLGVATLLYIIVSVVSVSAVSPQELFRAADPSVPLINGPLALVAERTVFPGAGVLLSVLALGATASTLLILLVVASRIIYGLAEQKLLPKIFREISSSTQTPFNAVIFSMLVAMAFCFVDNLQLLGKLATMGVFLLFFTTHASLVAIRFRERSTSFFRNNPIGWVPIPALLGGLFCAFMFLTQYWETINFFGLKVPLIFGGLVVFLTAIPFYVAAEKETSIENHPHQNHSAPRRPFRKRAKV